MKIVAGLGNPGRKYSGTRHNVGFEVVSELGKRFSAESWRNRFESEATEIQIAGERVLLLAPQTFMNLSGRSIKNAVDFYKSPLSELLVICDDLNLDVGRLRLRASGTAGGQKGLKNTIDQLGTTEFARLRVGIGRPDPGQDTVSFVLQTFTKAERETMIEAVDRAASATETWVRDGLAAAMNVFNRADDSAR
ncbi:aminoacyl-tRNA hydrolase [Planctomicrobium piriforme]|uniref:Peptidyl-tRNA hydrolase n=1 Tax=Planctomicrobium piriforme TaxID=1576369 RepID=A0A1I3L853_9PLAN|nr:aminoacyl-tRNA hydrolase [Planctomicrobium piriforme]SFI80829.1 peptidyl-tRNA hydrolase, PTH1 family [Planctomicrobium piriforme]